MSNAVDEHIEQMWAQDIADRRNGSFPCHLLTELGDLKLSVPRSRTFRAKAMVKKFFRRVFPVERLTMLAFIFGFSTRKVGQVLLSILGEKISPLTVSRVGQQLDSAVLAYHQRRLLIFGRFFRRSKCMHVISV